MSSILLFRLLARLAAVCVLLLLLVAPVLAQSQFRCHDDADRLDCARIEAAAKPLLDRGAAVAVYDASSVPVAAHVSCKRKEIRWCV